MQKLGGFLLLLLITLNANARPQDYLRVPIIGIDTFKPHWAWTWSYSNKKGEFYSAERYEVLEVNGNEVTIEMASRYHQGEEFSAHHRLYVNVQECLDAYKLPTHKGPWLFRMEYWTGKEWAEGRQAPSNAAFEEKFNCNPYVTNAVFKTKFAQGLPEVGGQKIFQQLTANHPERPWYFYEGPQAGIAAQRFAGESESAYAYTMHFVEYAEVTTPTPKFDKSFL